MERHIAESQEFIRDTIEEWQPSHVIVLWSGGNDSTVLADIATSMQLDRPIEIWSIDTLLSADGWRSWVQQTAKDSWPNATHKVYINRKGYKQYLEYIRYHGQPYSRSGHTDAYRRLKDRALDAIKKIKKAHRYDYILFLSGVRRAESVARNDAPLFNRRGSGLFLSPILYWSDADVLRYRADRGLPDNPFYETVGGSGDCQCNWAFFITYRRLQKYSPKLANGRVATIHELSSRLHGWGWDGVHEDQARMLEDFEDDGDRQSMASPFLCAGCDRSRVAKAGRTSAEQMAYYQREFAL